MRVNEKYGSGSVLLTLQVIPNVIMDKLHVQATHDDSPISKRLQYFYLKDERKNKDRC